MPKAPPHFDAVALLGHVALQDVGLRVSTNNPKRFREIIYATMRTAPHLRCRVYADRRSKLSYLLVKSDQAIPGGTEIHEEKEADNGS